MNRLCALLLLLSMSLLPGCNDKRPTATGIAQNKCDFRTAELHKGFCRISIYQLLSAPESWYGKSIYTTGYLAFGPGPSFGLAPAPASFDANDLIGCVQITSSYQLGPREPSDALSKNGVYVADVAGDFSAPINSVCSGKLSNVILSNVRWISPL